MNFGFSSLLMSFSSHGRISPQVLELKRLYQRTKLLGNIIGEFGIVYYTVGTLNEIYTENHPGRQLELELVGQ